MFHHFPNSVSKAQVFLKSNWWQTAKRKYYRHVHILIQYWFHHKYLVVFLLRILKNCYEIQQLYTQTFDPIISPWLAPIRYLMSPSAEPLRGSPVMWLPLYWHLCSNLLQSVIPIIPPPPICFQKSDENFSHFYTFSLRGTHICSKHQLLTTFSWLMRWLSGDAPVSTIVSDATENLKLGKNPDQRSEAREHF